jgi:alpha-methylacyl-CoA racemase
VEGADGLMEGFRPGVVERLGLSPSACLGRNPRLVYARMTGWGQDGPMSKRAGFDLNYLSLTGALGAIGFHDQPPPPPLLMVGDFGGGGAFMAMGMIAAFFEAGRSGKGQVVDASVIDGVHNLMAYVHGGMAGGTWINQRQQNIVDGGDFRYGTYCCADGGYIAVAAPLEPFLTSLTAALGLDLDELGLGDPDDRSGWPAYRRAFADIFATRTRDEWVEIFDSDHHCVTPVLDLNEAPRHAHNIFRQSFVDLDGVAHPAPAPRFSRTPSAISGPPPSPGSGGVDALEEWGVPAAEIAELRLAGAIA